MPELSDDLDARLSALRSDGPVLLPGAAAARRRGAQRTRRMRGALAGGGAAVLVLAVVLGTGLDRGQDRVLLPAATPPPAPGPVEPALEQALLDADDVSAVLGGRWTVRPSQDDDGRTSPLPSGCADAVVGGGPDTVARSFGPDGRAEQVLVRYPDDRSAAAALTTLVDALERCPATTPTTRLVGGLPGTSATRVYGERLGPEVTVPFAVEQLGRVVSAVSAPTLEELPGLVDAAAAELRATTAGDLPPSDDPPVSGDGVLESLLTVDDAAQVLPGTWTAATLPDSGTEVPPFPCGASGAPQAPGDGRVSAGVRMVVERETGGTVVRQEVVQHTGPTTAAEAYDLVRERVVDCPEQSLPDAQGPGTVVTEVVDAGPELEDGVRTLLVRVVSTCQDCLPAYEWYAVQQAGDLLSTTGAAEGEDGDRGVAVVQPFADLVAERLRGRS